MSLSSHNRLRCACCALAGVLALALTPAIHAQQVSFVPTVETTAEYDTNRLLSLNHGQSGEWYQALFAGDLQRQTVRSDLELRPQVTLQHSTISTLDRYEAQLNARGNYRTQKTVYQAGVTYHREDAYNAEYGLVEFNPINPGAPDTVGTGTLVTGITRNSYNISPNIVHTFTERFSGEFDGNFNAVRYSTDIPQNLVSFDSPYVELNGLWALSQRSQIGVGPFYSRYDPTHGFADGALKSQSYGADISYRYLTSQLTRSMLSLKIGRDEQDQFVGPRVSTTTWGLEWTGTYRWPTSRIQYSVGRFLEPSSTGGEVGLDQIRVQYSRTLSARLSGLGAFRVTRASQIGQGGGGNRDRAYGEASMQYALTREWGLQGGYRFGWQKISPATQSVQTHGVFITIGFHGLDPKR